MARGPKRVFTFKITYFKPSGKYYYSTEIEWEIHTTHLTNPSTPMMDDAVSKLKGLRDTGGQGAMPGFSDFASGWYGYILIDCVDGFPVLILPEGK